MTTWISLLLLILAIFKYPDQSFASTRALLYRIAYSFSPIQFSGTLLFIYAVKLLFEDEDTDFGDKSKALPEMSEEVLVGRQSPISTSSEDNNFDIIYPSMSPSSPSSSSFLK